MAWAEEVGSTEGEDVVEMRVREKDGASFKAERKGLGEVL